MNKHLYTILLSVGLSMGTGLPVYSTNTSEIGQQIYANLADMGLPLVVINTVEGEEPTYEEAEAPEGAWGAGITNATKVPAAMQIILHGDTLYDSGEYVKKESGLTVKIRGNTSALSDKKPYKLKLQKKADLLMREDKKYKDKDWVLLRTGSTLNTSIGFWTSELIGQEWTPAHRIVNLWMNGTYRGLYILCEQVTVNPECRINVDEKEGYVVEADAYWWNEDIYFDSTLTAPELKFTYKYPDPEDITDEWHEAVSSDVLANEDKITDGTFDEAYDCESFAKWLVSWELLGNADSGGSNMYVVKKDTDSKISMGPIWDFDNALKTRDSWIGVHNRFFYFHHMFNSPNDSFRLAFHDVWYEFGRKMGEELKRRINEFADSDVGVDYQFSLDLEKECGVVNDLWQPYLGDLEFMREYAIDFIDQRVDWIDTHIEEGSDVEVMDAVLPTGTSGKAYDVFGRRVGPDATGLIIRDGKKIFLNPRE